MMKELKCNEDNKASLVASWKFIAGDVNYRAMHLFRYPEVNPWQIISQLSAQNVNLITTILSYNLSFLKGWTDIDKTFKVITSDTKYQEAKKFERQLITNQSTEYVKSFSFWPDPQARTGGNIYDVRSYQLRPGKIYVEILFRYFKKNTAPDTIIQ